ncbi:MAG: hypothetical protein JSW35_04435 [Deltaproteobacteria bacterium]|nr:MAG: hypothetical protein JSW35_04435 [Deltaproteobacteria bacterium]
MVRFALTIYPDHAATQALESRRFGVCIGIAYLPGFRPADNRAPVIDRVIP